MLTAAAHNRKTGRRARRGDEKSRDRRGDHAAAAERHGDERHRGAQQRARQQAREKRRARGLVDGARESHQECAQREVPQLRHAEHRRHADDDHRDRGIRLRAADQLARIDAIGQHAAQQRQGELGHETAKMDEAQLRLRSRDLEGEPAQREREHVLADDLRDEREPVEAEVAHLERGEGIRFVF